MDFYRWWASHQMERPHENSETFTAPIRIQLRLVFPCLADEKPVFVLKVLRQVVVDTARLPGGSRQNPGNRLNKLPALALKNADFKCYDDHMLHPAHTLFIESSIVDSGMNIGRGLIFMKGKLHANAEI